jgi:predicted phosphodiesterase
MNAVHSFASAVTTDGIPSDYSVASDSVCEGQKADVTAVGQDRLSHEQRESAIRLAGDLVVKYEDEYERTACFAARGNADRFRLMQRQLIAGRTNPQERTE